ncbi:MAG: glycosyltransferase family 25 protein [Chthoniobacterales bacterium]|nr:glycosyltransferase family 25 protein [Chthoniobacterales bacterium]
MNQLHAYVINLDRAHERWAFVEESFATTHLIVHRIPAIDGRTLTLASPDFHAKKFQLLHGRLPNIYELACSLSHLKALQTFLESGQEHALICEDDLVLQPELEEILAGALKYASAWNILRLTGLKSGAAIAVCKLTTYYSLCVQMNRLKGGGAYLLDRKAAEIFVKKLYPMWLPWDHAFDREWVYGLKALSVLPFPISQTKERFPSTIQTNSKPKLPTWQRVLTTYPYQALNELQRYFFRGKAVLTWKLGSVINKDENNS